jgi:hypothetical protein
MDGSDLRVDLYGVDVNSVGPCGAIDLASVELRYYINSTACGVGFSCVTFAGPIPSVNSRHYQCGIVNMYHVEDGSAGA